MLTLPPRLSRFAENLQYSVVAAHTHTFVAPNAVGTPTRWRHTERYLEGRLKVAMFHCQTAVGLPDFLPGVTLTPRIVFGLVLMDVLERGWLVRSAAGFPCHPDDIGNLHVRCRTHLSIHPKEH
jgi:hypothetical protein